MGKNYNWFPSEKDIEGYVLLKDMLHSQSREFSVFSSKKPDEQLNPMKIKMVNRVLEPLKNLFSNESSHKFLDTLKEEDMPTNSDVVLIISQYVTAITEFRNKYYLEDKYKKDQYEHPVTRWMTQEHPTDYYENRE